MRLFSRVSIAAVLALLAGLISAPMAQATPSNGDWTFTGTLTAPARSTTNVTATLSGTATISAATLQAVGCDDTVNAPARGVIALRNTVNSSVLALTGTGTTLTSNTHTAVSATATLAPGTSYELVLQYRCGAAGAIRGTITPATEARVAVASQVSTRSITRACLPTVPETPCTRESQQVTSVPVGLTLTFAGLIASTWSDGVVTEDPVTGTQSLQRSSGSSWSTVSTTCATTVTINASELYRCSSTNGGQHEQISITAMQPTTSLTITPPVVTPITTLIGETARVQVAVLMNYSDGSQWPAPTTITYRVEFLPLNSTSWQTLTGPHSLDSRGNVNRTFTFPGSGRLRITAGTATSQLIEIVEAVASNEYVFSNLNVPISSEPGQAITISATVGQKWTDGVVRRPTISTEVVLEYAVAYTPNAADLTWLRAEGRQLISGTTSISVTGMPQASGFWRLRAGTGTSTPVYIPVTGSRAPTVKGSMLPVAGSEPFAGRSSNFSVSVSIEGYVGTKDLEVLVDFAGVSTRVGSVSRTATVSGNFSLQGPRVPGPVTPAFIIRDDQGFVWARSNATPITVDGLVTFEPVLIQPDPVPLNGMNTTFVARMQGKAYSGGTRDGVWFGPSELQEFTNGQWLTVARAEATTSSLVSFPAKANKGSQYRVIDASSGSMTPVLDLRVLVPTGVQRVPSTFVEAPRVEVGDAVTVSAFIEARYDDGNFHMAPDGVVVTVLYQDESGSRTVGQATTVAGRVSATFKPRFAGDVIFVAADGTRSEPTRVNLVRPDRFDVNWPKDIPQGKPLAISVFARASDGPRWRKPIIALFQYQPYGVSKWTTIKRMTLDRGRVGRAQVSSPKAGTYRVFSPEFNFFKDARYG